MDDRVTDAVLACVRFGNRPLSDPKSVAALTAIRTSLGTIFATMARGICGHPDYARWKVDSSNPGYLVGTIDQFQLRVPWHLMLDLPAEPALKEFLNYASRLKMRGDSAICVSGSLLAKAAVRAVSDVDLCEYVTDTTRTFADVAKQALPTDDSDLICLEVKAYVADGLDPLPETARIGRPWSPAAQAQFPVPGSHPCRLGVVDAAPTHIAAIGGTLCCLALSASPVARRRRARESGETALALARLLYVPAISNAAIQLLQGHDLATRGALKGRLELHERLAAISDQALEPFRAQVEVTVRELARDLLETAIDTGARAESQPGSDMSRIREILARDPQNVPDGFVALVASLTELVEPAVRSGRYSEELMPFAHRDKSAAQVAEHPVDALHAQLDRLPLDDELGQVVREGLNRLPTDEVAQVAADLQFALDALKPALEELHGVPPDNAVRLGRQVRVKGDVEGSEDLLIDGQVEGAVRLIGHAVTIGTTGSVKGAVEASIVVVDGWIEGPVTATERIELRDSGRIDGDVRAPRIAISDGAEFRGSVDVSAAGRRGQDAVQLTSYEEAQTVEPHHESTVHSR